MSIFKMKDGERSRWVVQAYHKNKKFRVYTNPKTKKTITSYKEAGRRGDAPIELPRAAL